VRSLTPIPITIIPRSRLFRDTERFPYQSIVESVAVPIPFVVDTRASSGFTSQSAGSTSVL